MADDVRVPAGWYPDPLGLPQLRWWDNHAWTEYTSDARQPMVAQETVTQQTRLTYAEDDGLTRRERREAEQVLAPEAATDGVRARTTTPALLGESLLALEAPQPDDRLHHGPESTEASLAAPAASVGAPIAEEELSPAAKFAEFVPATPASAPAFDLDTRFEDAVAAQEPPAAVTEAVPGSVGSFFAQPTTAPASAFSYDYPSVTGTSAAAAARTPTVAPAVAPLLRKNTSTGPVWLIAVFPLLGLFTALVMLASKITDPTGTIIGLAAFVVPYVLGIPFAVADWVLLKRRGYDSAHWLWAFATPAAYLIARAVVLIRAGGRGYGPLLGSSAFAALAFGVALAVPGIVIGLNPTGYSASIEQTVEQQAKALGAEIDVTCPSTPPTIVGESFVCQASDTGKNPLTWGVTVSLQRSNGWISWRVDDWGIFMASSGTGK